MCLALTQNYEVRGERFGFAMTGLLVVLAVQAVLLVQVTGKLQLLQAC